MNRLERMLKDFDENQLREINKIFKFGRRKKIKEYTSIQQTKDKIIAGIFKT